MRRLITIPLFGLFIYLNYFWYKNHTTLDIYMQMGLVLFSIAVYFVATMIEVFYAKKANSRKLIFKILITILIIYYCSFLCAVLFLDDYFFSRSNTIWVNKIPFKTIKNFYRNMRYNNDLRAFANLLGNAILFAPMGFLLPMLSKIFRKTYFFVPFITLIIAGCEYLQYYYKIGTADIDDIILNVIGAFICFLLFKFITFLAKEKLEILFKEDLKN